MEVEGLHTVHEALHPEHSPMESTAVQQRQPTEGRQTPIACLVH